MLEIKFRAKSFNDQWVYGNLIKMDRGGSQSFIFPFYESASSMSCGQVIAYNMIPIDIKTVGQFIGRYDKQDFYVGDIINCWGGECLFGVWEYSRTIKISDIRDVSELTDVCWERIEIIGNIHDNPESVEEGVLW